MTEASGLALCVPIENFGVRLLIDFGDFDDREDREVLSLSSFVAIVSTVEVFAVENTLVVFIVNSLQRTIARRIGKLLIG